MTMVDDYKLAGEMIAMMVLQDGDGRLLAPTLCQYLKHLSTTKCDVYPSDCPGMAGEILPKVSGCIEF